LREALDVASVFVSHANEDREWVRRYVVDPLRAAGHTPFFSDESLKGGDNFLREITNELANSEKLLVVVSSRSANSRWVITEVEIWFRKHGDNNPIPVLMESVEACDVHPRLVYCQSIDLSNPTLRQQHTGKLLSELAGARSAGTSGVVESDPHNTVETSSPRPKPSVVGNRSDNWDQPQPADGDDTATQIERISDVPGGRPQPPPVPNRDQTGLPPTKENWTVLVLDAVSGRPIPGIGVRLRPDAGGSFARQFISRLGTHRGTTNLSGKVFFPAPSSGTTVEVSLEDFAQYRQMPPIPGFVKPRGVNTIIFVARRH
jgi:TIR domain